MDEITDEIQSKSDADVVWAQSFS